MLIEDLDTPILVIDLDALEENLDRYQQYFNLHGIGLRAHIKTHKTLAIASMQMARGAIGLACQKLGEVEVMVAGGLRRDLLLTNNIIGKQKLDRLTALALQAKVWVIADSEDLVQGLSLAANAAGCSIDVLVEIETGAERTGVVTPQAAAKLAKLIHTLPGLELKGLMSMPTPPEKRATFQETLDLFDRAGLPHPVVSGGGTKYALRAHEIPELTEWRAGEYAVGGANHLWEGRHSIAQCALRVLTTVISRPTERRAILDAGVKTLSASLRDGPKGKSMGHIVEYPEAHFYGASEEHGHVDVSDCGQKPKIGEHVQVIPAHSCPCINEHDQLVAIRKGRVEAVWPIDARGKIR